MTEEEIIPNDIQKGQVWNKPLTPLMIQFEKETGNKAILINGRITGKFTYWLYKKGLKTSNFSEINQVMSKALKETFATPESKEKHSKASKKNWQNPEFRKKMTGENSSMYGKHHSEEAKKKIGNGNRGKIGEEAPNWKGDNVGYGAIHLRVRKTKIKPENCEICGFPEYYGNLGHLELSNIKNHNYTDNPNDYQYIHHNCHMKYDSYNLVNTKLSK